MYHGTWAVFSLFTVLPLLSELLSSCYTQTFLAPKLQDALAAAFTLSFQSNSSYAMPGISEEAWRGIVFYDDACDCCLSQ